jgi:hypothetical protein
LNIWALGQNKISGRVIDNVTKEPLAFVNIVYNNSNQGTTTDLDGYFFIESSIPVKTLYLSYIGYNKDTVNIVEGKKYLELSLNPEIAQLNEVVVLPGVNPAHRIINSVVENRKLNSPESLESFAYTSYNKFYATIDLADIPIVDTSSLQTDSIAINREASDTVPDSTVNRLNRAKNLLDKQYFLLMESVSERKFKHPDKNSEIVIANRISGLQNPMFFMLATQMQSFSFYEEHITLYDKEYLNPISKGSTDKYFFLLTDTIYTEQFDTVFIITFRPRKGKNFDGLEGTLHINSNKYALQHVLASPAEQGSLFSIQIQQKYEYIQNKQWFPVQLNTNFTFQSLNVSIDGYNAPLKGIGKSYINNIMINPEFENKLFDHIVVSTEKNAHKKDEEFWNKYRPDSLSIKEKNTYQVIDSLGDEANIDEKIAMLEVIATGQIPIGFMNIDLSKLMWYNNYEGYRLGLGINTNQKLLKWCALGIYGAYGFRDKAFKYGGNIDFSIWKAAEFHFGALYRNDIEISDNYNFLWTSSFLSTELYRDFLLTEFDPIETYEAYAELRMLRYLKTRVVFNYNSRNISNFQRYYYEDVPLDENGLMQYYQAEISAKYAFKEKFIETPKGNKISMGTNWPVLWLNASYGFIGNLSGDTFLKIQSQVDKKFTINALGDMSIRLTAGFADNNTPYSMLYKGYGSYSWLDAGNTFNTMRVNEFISDRFVHAFIKHDFGSLLFRTKKWRPEIAVLTNIGWSTWSRGAIPTGYIGPYNKWYFESGLQFNYLLRATFIGYGFGAYYRYGAYHLPDLIDNFAFKLTLTYDF